MTEAVFKVRTSESLFKVGKLARPIVFPNNVNLETEAEDVTIQYSFGKMI